MTTTRSKASPRQPRRTPCNLAALMALGLLVGAAGPALAVQSGNSTQLLNNVILRGLVSDYRTSATFAQTSVPTGQTLTITQLLPKIILDWNKFNLANGDTIQFIQPSSSAAVLNRIYDANPTEISGAIKANGQVFLVNQNGILFHNGTQIDTNSFFASTLNISDDAFNAGVTSGGNFTPAFQGRYDVAGVTTTTGPDSGGIVVGGGSSALKAPAINAAAGGAVVIVAPVINNDSGIIQSPDGQVILAAGRAAYLSFGARDTTTSFRGMLVEVTADNGAPLNLSALINGSTVGTVANSGTISSDRGNVTLAGLAINQSGRVSAKSAMLTNGSIYLQARTLDNAQAGKVTLSANSVTETPLDASDTTTLSESTSFDPYRPVVTITGKSIDVEGRITSPSGNVSLNALQDATKAGTPRIYLGDGSLIDASGAWSTASDASNLLTFKVTSTELKTVPDQQGGVLLGATVTVDLRQGSNVLDLSAYQANQARTLQQKAAVGGVVTLTSSGDVIERSDATVNVSGGGVHYTGATEVTSKLLGSDGKLYDIATAPEALRYTTLADSFTDTQARWGFSPVYTNLLMGASVKRPDYTEGAAGGQLGILAGPTVSGLVLDGSLLGGTTTGSQQTGAAPRGATLVIGTFDSSTTGQHTGIGDVTFQSGAPSSLPAGFSVDTPLADSRKSQVSLSTDVLAAGDVDAAGNYVTTGFGSVAVNADGRITVPENVTINGPLGGGLTLRGNQVEIDGHVNLPAGTVLAQTIAPSTGSIVLNQGAGISTAGEWINSSTTGIQSPLPTAMANPPNGTAAVAPSPTANGGSISLQGPVVQLASGSTLDVSAGGVVSAKGSFTGGSAGSISLNATAAPTATSAPLTLDGTLTGYGFGNGGTLSLSTNDVVQITATGAASGTSGLTLATGFFEQGGFQSYSISAAGDLDLVAGAILQPRQQSLQIDATTAQGLATGANARAAATLVTLTDDVRKPTSLSLGSKGKLTVQADSGIGTDVGASVTLAGVNGLAVDGAVYAPGGSIALGDNFGASVSLNMPDSALPTIELGADAIVSTRGTFTARANDKGLTLGTVSAGGSVSVTASAAHVVMDAGSVIDVGGASQVVDIPSAIGSGVPYRAVQQSSNAGTVSITANDSVVLGGAIRANADASAAGGTFNLTLNERGDVADPTSGRRIVVTQSGAAQPTDAAFKDVAVSVDKLRGGGFDKVNLAAEDQIVFGDSATLAFQRGVMLNTKLMQVADDANVVVSGAAVKLADSFGVRQPTSAGNPADPSMFLNPTLASVAQPTSAGSGTLRVNADTLDVAGSVTVGGTQSVTLSAVHDLRLSGRTVVDPADLQHPKLIGGLVTAGDLTLSAAQVYPTTGSAFTVSVADGLTGIDTPNGQLTVTHGSGAQGDVLSAGGSLTLKADRIAQEGVVEAPLGTLALQAGTTLTLGNTSVTSVSANGLTIPYGETQNGVTWTYAPLGKDPVTASLAAPPSKNISLNAPAVDVLTGAKVDVSGGGDVAAIEYVPTGNSSNLLASTTANTYAIMPAANLSAAPIDPDIASTLGQLGAVYNSIRIGPGGAVPAGNYVLVPGYYGLLKGGYMVQLLTGSTYANLQNGQTATLQNGVTVVPGVLTTAGTAVASGATIGVAVRPNSDIAKYASYTVTNSSFFATLADANRSAVPALPADGGQLSIAATQRLTLNGTLEADLPGAASRSAEVDISATKIALVDQVGRGDIDPSYLQIDSAGLSKLDADLLIGGVRSTTSKGEVVTTIASDIVVANSQSQPLDSPELTLAATDSITVRSGSRIDGTGKQVVKPVDFSVAGTGAASGAILRVSTGGLANVTRPATDGSQGTVTIESGATVAADGSLALDATRTTKSSGNLDVAKGGALALVSGSVSLGETDGVAGLDNGLVLDNAELAGFNALGTLSLKSYGGITLYGNAQVGSVNLANLVLDGASLTGQSLGAPATAAIKAQNITLVNTSGTDAAPGAAGTGSLSVVATQQLTLGAGSKQVAGYADTQLVATGDGKSAPGEIVAAGTGSLQTASPLELTAARITSTSGADQTWTAQDGTAAGGGYKAVTIAGNGSTVKPADSTSLGSRLQVTGATVSDSGAIVMKSGGIVLQAMSGDVALTAGATLDAGGASKSFQGTIATADAGQLTLNAEHGNVLVDKSSSLNLSADAAGGNAGSLTINAAGADLSGSFTATAAKGLQGAVALNLATLDDAVAGNAAAGGFSAINAMLNAAGFTESRDVRVRDQDVAVAASDVVHAHHLTLESDAGAVTVSGTLDASATQGGGSVAVSGNSVTVTAGATIDASGTSLDPSSYANGGSVSVVAEGGTLDFAKGATVDVRAGALGSAGSVLLRAPRTTGGTSPLAATLQGQVLGQRHATDAAAQVAIEGNQVYTVAPGTSLDATAFNAYGNDNIAFMAAVGAAPVGTGITGDGGTAQGNVHVRPAVEVVSAGDLTVAQNWNLTGAGWRIKPAGGSSVEAGSLVVRAAGNLTFAGASVGNPDNALQSGPTWNIALTSGADLKATDTARTQTVAALAAQGAGGAAGAGDLVLDSSVSEASVRTGSGNIDIAAGRDFVIKAGVDPDTGNPTPGVVYTTGVAAIKDPLTSAADNRFTQGGGDVTIAAQRDAIGSGNEWMTEWYRAATVLDGGFANGMWWTARQNFHDGVAALGGGNVTVVAGRDLRDLSAWVPTSAIQAGTRSAPALQAFGGGNLDVQAGNDIVGGQYLVGLGQGTIAAGGDIGGAGQSSQLFLMGASGDAARSGATATLKAGGAVNLATIDNPGVVAQTPSTGVGPGFSDTPVLSTLSYSPRSAVTVSALSGDLRIGNSPNAALLLNPIPDEDILAEQQNASGGVAVLPARVAFQAFNGSIVYTGTAVSGSGEAAEVLFPAIDGGAKLLAGKSVVGMTLRVSDADPAQFDVAHTDQSNTMSYSDILNGVGGAATGRIVTNSSPDTFINDVVALDGSVTGVTLTFPSRSRIWAAQDIFNAALGMQNLLPSDISELVAQSGSIVIGQPTPWGIDGPGSLLLQAGQNVDLGVASLTSFGNLRNSALPSTGADIDVLAGYSGTIDLAKLYPTFKALQDAGSAKKPDDATAAISRFLDKDLIGKGDIDSFDTSIQSAAGGNINLMAPGGNITVGLPTPSGSTLIGVVTNAGGAIRSFLKGDFNINQGKVLTAQGGDILIYTTDGGIDAGRGAKTSVTTPPPVRTPMLDDHGNIIGYTYSLPVAVAGSGIQTATSKPNGPDSVAPPAGNIYLFAPKGTIDAGEAGIKSGGAIFVAALTVLNADNISSVGASQGVPVTPPGSVASTVAASTGTATVDTKANDAAAQAAAAAAAAGVTNFRPAILTVEVMGFGDKNCKETDKDCFAK